MKQERQQMKPALLLHHQPHQQSGVNRPNPPQQLNANFFRNNRMPPPPIQQPPVCSARSQMEIERAAAEQWSARTGRRPSSAAAPFGASRPRNHSLPEVYHGPTRSCPPPATRVAVSTWRGFPPLPSDGHDGRRRGAEPLNLNANPCKCITADSAFEVSKQEKLVSLPVAPPGVPSFHAKACHWLLS